MVWDLIATLAIIAIDWIWAPLAAASSARTKSSGVKKPVLSDFNFPTTSKDRAIPVGYGTFMADAPNLCWYGNLSHDATKVEDEVVYYQSVLGLYYQPCLGPLVAAHGDGLLEIKFEDKTAWQSPTPVLDTEIFINATALFGGKGFGGGISGYARIYSGGYDQAKDAYLQAAIFAGTSSRAAISRTTTTPPSDVVHYDLANKIITDMYLVPAAATGAWAGHEDEMAYPLDIDPITEWSFRHPDLHERVYVEDEETTVEWDGEAWQDVGAIVEIPAWRGRVGLVFGRIDPATQLPVGVNVGEGANLRPPKFVLRRLPVALGSGKHDIDGDANPAEILYECLTGMLPQHEQLIPGTITPWYGMAIPPSMIDTDKLLSLATLFENEKRGWSGLVETPSVEDFIVELANHCNLVPYTDLSTGKCTFQEIREDYDLEEVLHLTPSNSRLVKFTPGDPENTATEARVSYLSRANGFAETSAAPVVDPANLAALGEVRVLEVARPGTSNEELARRQGEEALQGASSPLAGAELLVNREGHELHKGSVVVWDYAPLSVSNVVFRVTDVGYPAPAGEGAGNGDAGDGEWIAATLVEDHFSAGSVVAGTIPQLGWVDPVRPPERAIYQSIYDLPFYLARRFVQDPDWQRQNLLGCVAARSNKSCTHYDVLLSLDGTDYERKGQNFTFTPAALLAAEYPKNTDAIDASGNLLIQSAIDIERLSNSGSPWIRTSGANLAFIGHGDDDGKPYDEVVAFETITANGDGTWTLSDVWRGLLDTVPKTHPAGTPIWFITYGMGVLRDPHEDLVVIDAKYLPRTSRGVLPAESATPLRLTMLASSQRAVRPYPPGRIRVNDAEWPVALTGDVDVVLQWAHRNRTSQVHVLHQDDESVPAGPEPNSASPFGGAPSTTVYALEVWGEGNLHEPLAIYDLDASDTSFTLDSAEEQSITGSVNPSLGRLNDRLTLKLYAHRFDPDASGTGAVQHISEPQVREVDMAGYGALYGEYYGGY
jgi:hypothetical protein